MAVIPRVTLLSIDLQQYCYNIIHSLCLRFNQFNLLKLNERRRNGVKWIHVTHCINSLITSIQCVNLNWSELIDLIAVYTRVSFIQFHSVLRSRCEMNWIQHIVYAERFINFNQFQSFTEGMNEIWWNSMRAFTCGHFVIQSFILHFF